MKKRRGFWISSAVAAVVAAIFTVCACVFEIKTQLQFVYLPFALLGKGLRALSLSGSGGNAAAIVLYVLICLIPALVALVAFFRDKKFTVAKLILVLLSGYSFAMMYFFINPNVVRFAIEMPQEAREEFLLILNLGMAFAFYGLLLFSAAIKLAVKAKREEAAFYRTVRLLCAFAGCALVFVFFGIELTNFLKIVPNGIADAILGGVALLLHGALYGLLYAAACVAYGGAGNLKANLYSPENVKLLKRVSKLCLWDFLGSIAVCVILNVLNFALTPVLHNITFEFTVSVSVAAIAAVCLFAANLLLRAINLYEENRLTI